MIKKQIPELNTGKEELEPILEAILENTDEKMEETNSLLESLILQKEDDGSESSLEAIAINTDKMSESLESLNKKNSTVKVNIKNASVIKLKGEKGEKGTDGKTPEFGKDYFTDKQIKKITKEIIERVESEIRVPEDGKTPEKFKDYFTAEEVEDIVDIILSKIPVPEDGNDGETPEIDYDVIIQQVLSKIPVPKTPPAPKAKKETDDELVERLKGKIAFRDLKDYSKLNVFNSDIRTFIQLQDTPSSYTGQAGKFVKVNSAGTGLEFAIGGGGGTGDVVGPASATDNAIARYDSTTGKLLQNSSITISDGGLMGVNTGASTPNAMIEIVKSGSLSHFMLSSAVGGSSGDIFNVDTNGGFVFNDRGSAVDFRIEADTDTHNFFSHGTNGRIGIGTGNPLQKFHVRGRVQFGDANSADGSIDLGNSTSAGLTRLSPSVPESDIECTLPAVDCTISYDYPMAYIGDSTFAPTSAENVFADNRAWYKAVTVHQPCTITGIRIGVSASSGNICVGIYNNSRQLLTSSSVACPASNTKATITLESIFLVPGIYWLALSANNTTARFVCGGDDTILGLAWESNAFPLPGEFGPSFEPIGGNDRSFAIVGILETGIQA